ncbi:MAG: hypothetical protein AB1758_32340, partial [Candidatus Eremiobacterota bacterium]
MLAERSLKTCTGVGGKAVASLFGLIGVWTNEQGRTFYVKRSPKMKNYPSVWSLFSIQYDPKELTDPEDLAPAQHLM